MEVFQSVPVKLFTNKKYCNKFIHVLQQASSAMKLQSKMNESDNRLRLLNVQQALLNLQQASSAMKLKLQSRKSQLTQY